MIYQDYYSTPSVRETCHLLKESEDPAKRAEAIERAARYLAEEGGIDRSCFVIPAPQHTGKAEYARELCERIAGLTGAAVADIVRCRPHVPVYLQKRHGTRTRPEAEFFLAGAIPEGGRMLLVDNVISTGGTFNRINALFGGKLQPMPYAVDYTRLKDETVLRILCEAAAEHSLSRRSEEPKQKRARTRRRTGR